MPKFLLIDKGKDFFLVSYCTNLEDEDRRIFEFNRKVNNKIYVAGFAATESFAEQYCDEIVECLKSVGDSQNSLIDASTSGEPSIPIPVPPVFTVTPTPLEPKFDGAKLIKSHQHISSGYYYSTALKNDGTVWIWGKLENSSTEYITHPYKISNVTDALKISNGGHYTLILKKDGTVWTGMAYGDVSVNLIILGSCQVSGLTNIIDISAGYDGHSIALKQDGTVYEWENFLATPSTHSTTIKVTAVKDMSEVKRIAAGYGFSAALKNDGSVWIWFNTTYERADRVSIPTKIKKLDNITDISAGQSFIAALNKEGNLITMGGTLEKIFNINSPVKTYKFSGIKEITAQLDNWAAILSNGMVMTGGYSKKTEVVPNLKNVAEISYGNGQLLILKEDGSLHAMGSNQFGQLGDGTTIDRKKPVRIFFNLNSEPKK